MARMRAATRSNTRPAPCSTSKATSAQVIDALGRIVMRYDYDMLGTRIHQASMEAGERWTLNDVDRQADPRLEQPQICVPHGI